MKKIITSPTIKLAGFNNLTKCLSFNLYDFCVAANEADRKAYQEFICERYSAERITDVLRGICDIIDANVLAVSDQNYDPWGASSLVLMSDIKGASTTAMHLDKSHICAHTYPDFGIGGEVCTFRVDIDIATCGEISPLSALNFMFEKFETDVVVIDYVVRGYTRDTKGKRVYLDHEVNSIKDFIRKDILADYTCLDLAVQSENIWQTKMLRTNLDEDSYFMGDVDLADPAAQRELGKVKQEMRAVVHMWPD